jgi:lysophospholipase L1-like esterase
MQLSALDFGKMRITGIWVALGVFCLAATASAPPDFYLHDGDTVVFYGDSITSQLLYSIFTEAYVSARFPQLHVRFVHSGWAGDRVSGGFGGPIDRRLDRDVFAYHPTVVTILLGMNDGEYQPFNQQLFDKYSQGYRHIVERIKKELPHARITLLKPTPYDDVTRPPEFEGGYDSVQARFGDFVEELAKSEHLDLADLHTPVVAFLKAANQHLPPRDAQLQIPDRVHPSDGVHLVMAAALLQAWHAPSLVTAVEIDGSSGVVKRSEDTTVSAVEAGDVLSWTQEDKALPMAIDKRPETIEIALRYSDVVKILDQETLQVTGLSPGKYRLQIDGQTAGVFDSREMEQGISLGQLPTPMVEQSLAVQVHAFKHNYLHLARWRMVEDSYKDDHLPGTRPAADALNTLEERAIALQRATAQPKPHHYQLIPDRGSADGPDAGDRTGGKAANATKK